MIKLLKIFSIAFLLMQFTASARYYSSEMGRFINRDPIGNPQDPRDIMAQNEVRYQATVNRGFIQRDSSHPRYSEPNGYHDGMSLYNAYFAEHFSLDPTGMDDLWTYFWNPIDSCRTWTCTDEGAEGARKITRIGPHNGYQDALRHCITMCSAKIKNETIFIP